MSEFVASVNAECMTGFLVQAEFRLHVRFCTFSMSFINLTSYEVHNLGVFKVTSDQ